MSILTDWHNQAAKSPAEITAHKFLDNADRILHSLGHKPTFALV
jgi:hypothetical protein